MPYSILHDLVILFAEDHPLFRENISHTLRTYFKEVHCAADGKEAWELYERVRPDMILTDVEMPHLNGIELAQRIREQGDRVSITMLSAHGNQSYLLKAIPLHLEEYLIKPVPTPELISALAHSAQKLRNRRTNTVELCEQAQYCYGSKQILYPDRTVQLTNKEIDLFELLLARRRQIVYYGDIEATVWESEEASHDALKSMVKKLRKKLPSGSLKNIPGVGYRLIC